MKKEWIMPIWMEKYRDTITNTGGNTIEDCVNRKGVTFFNNLPMATIQCMVTSQVQLLQRLYDDKLIS